jgi:hypothetical protein
MNKTMSVQQTSNYEIFADHKNNRAIAFESKKYKKLLGSMKRLGFLPFFPLWCKLKSDGKLEVQMGHHRLTAAMQLKIPVWYMVYEAAFEIWREKETSKPWELKDYLTSYSSEGDIHAIAIKQYHEETGIPIGMCCSLLGGESAGSSNKGADFEQKRFQIPPSGVRAAERMAAIVEATKKADPRVATARYFVASISKCFLVPGFDDLTFIKKVCAHPHLVKRQAGIKEYLEMVESVYNYKSPSSKVLPLRMLAIKASAANSCFKR